MDQKTENIKQAPWWRHPLVWLCGIALLARLASLPVSVPQYDTGFYRDIAANLLAGKGYSLDGSQPELYWMPGAVVLHVIAQSVHPSLLATKLLWVFLGVGLVAVAFGMAQHFFSRRVAVIFAALMAIYPFNLVWGLYATTEIPNLILLMGTAWLIGVRASPWLIGLCFGIACLVRAPDLAFLPLVLAGASWRSGTVALMFRRACFVLTAFLLCIAPWSIRTSLCAGTFVPLSAGGLKNVWMGTNPWYIKWIRTEMDMQDYARHIYGVLDRNGMSYADQNRAYKKAIVDFVKSDPAGFAEVMAYKSWRFFLVPPGWSQNLQKTTLPGHMAGHGSKFVWMAGWVYVAVVVGALGALWMSWRQRSWSQAAPWLLWIAFAYGANVWFDAVVAYRYKSGAETCMLLLASWFIVAQMQKTPKAARQVTATAKAD